MYDWLFFKQLKYLKLFLLGGKFKRFFKSMRKLTVIVMYLLVFSTIIASSAQIKVKTFN